jgi:hypothetical protein
MFSILAGHDFKSRDKPNGSVDPIVAIRINMDSQINPMQAPKSD